MGRRAMVRTHARLASCRSEELIFSSIISSAIVREKKTFSRGQLRSVRRAESGHHITHARAARSIHRRAWFNWHSRSSEPALHAIRRVYRSSRNHSWRCRNTSQTISQSMLPYRQSSPTSTIKLSSKTLCHRQVHFWATQDWLRNDRKMISVPVRLLRSPSWNIMRYLRQRCSNCLEATWKSFKKKCWQQRIFHLAEVWSPWKTPVPAPKESKTRVLTWCARDFLVESLWRFRWSGNRRRHQLDPRQLHQNFSSQSHRL